jgi:hypothetical protein
MWELKDLIKNAGSTQTEINGKWVPARPLNYKYTPWYIKFKYAWEVFRGRAEAFKWPEGQ